MHLKTALLGLNFNAFEYSWDETGGATRIGLALLHIAHAQANNIKWEFQVKSYIFSTRQMSS